MFPPLIEAFLIVEQPRQRLGYWSQVLAPLDDGRAPPLATVAAYYDPTTDEALLGLRYDELALGHERLGFVVEVALLAEIGMIQPAELSEGDRRRFLGERLERCTVHVVDQRNVVGALGELVRRLRELRSRPGTTRPPSVPAARATMRPRGTTQDPVLLVQPRSTRDDIPRLSREDGAPRRPDEVRTTSPHVIARPSTPRGDVHRAQTVELSPIELHRMAMGEQAGAVGEVGEVEVEADDGSLAAQIDSMPPPPVGARRACSPSQLDTEPNLPARPSPGLMQGAARPSPGLIEEAPRPSRGATESVPLPPRIIYARYLRSGRWVPIRIGALSLKGAALMAGALPRLHDHVDVALAFGDHRALVRGPVHKVSSAEEAAQSGAATFSVSFDLDANARRQLTGLLTAARAANITIKPPPPRQARRYPVDWPVCLGTMRGAVRADALDVSRDGMFVRPTNALTLDVGLNFSAVLDDGEAPISGRAKVIRHISEQDARHAGLAPGYGLKIVDMGEDARQRWHEFLTRVERRAEKRVLVGAAPSRLNELQQGLSAAGYAVTGGTDPGALVQLASSEVRPVDACLLDAGWLSPNLSASWVESMVAARNVPCVTMHGDARGARSVVDKLLAIV
ncbi:MAG: PilZ domain-containing protein [Kofleriaceae bacterium]